MPRIADSELKRLKEEISVQRLVEASGIELSRAGKDFAGRCPFHEDDTASLLVTPAKNLWHCFGCGIGGGPIDWVMKKNGVSFRHAVELLREGMPALAADSTSTAPHRGWVRALPIPVALQADDQALMHQVVDYYHASLKTSPEALAYLQSRGFTGEAAQWMIDTFKLGYGNRTLGLRLPTKSRKDGAEIRTRLEALGIYRESGHEHMNGSLVVPLYALPESHHHDADQPLPVVNLYGRKIRHDLRAGTPLHLYLANRDNESSRRGVFNPRALLAGDGVTVNEELIVCEAIIDALTFWCAGYRNVTTAYGVEGVTAELMQAIARMATCGLKRVLIAFDRDEAGERGAAKFADKLIALGLNCYRIEFPKGMDANDYAMKVQPAHKALGLLIRKAVWLGKGSAPARQNVPPTVQVVESQPSQNGVYSGITALAPSTNPAPTLAAKDRSEIATLASQNLPAAAVPSAPVDTAATVSEREVVLSFGEGKDTRRWRVRGLPKNLAVGVLKVNVMVNVDDGNSSLGAGFHVDTFDLYAARARAVFVQQAMIETGLPEAQLKSDLGRVLLKLEALQDAAIADALDPSKSSTVPLIPAMTDAEHESAMNLLQSPDLLARIEADFEACGVVGEGTNKRVAYLAAVSRLLERPLAVVIQSSSAAGKSSLMEAVLAFVPPEAKSQYSAMTGQSLFYMGETSLKHKVLAIAEEEGASRASYALKLLQSEGELTIASTGSDPKTGNLITQEYRVEGPTMLMMTTTAIDIDEELMNRCLVLTVDEERAQTARIHALQRTRRTLTGLRAREGKKRILATHQNAQRLLKPLAVVNPWADQLTFLDDRTRTRRDHEKYLTLIDVIALLHQHQRPIKSIALDGQRVDYIEATLEDIAAANAIAHEVLGRSLDELPPQTRRLLKLTVAYVETRAQHEQIKKNELRFTRGELRAATGLGDTQLKIHLARLAELEYVLVHRVLRGQGFEYELLYGGDAKGVMHLSGLIDPQALKTHATYDDERSGLKTEPSAQNPTPSAQGRAAVGSLPVGSQSHKTAATPMHTGLGGLSESLPDVDDEISIAPSPQNGRSYRGQLAPSRVPLTASLAA